MRALLINEFTAPRWQKPYTTDPSQNVGQALLYVFNFPLDYWWAFSLTNAASQLAPAPMISAAISNAAAFHASKVTQGSYHLSTKPPERVLVSCYACINCQVLYNRLCYLPVDETDVQRQSSGSTRGMFKLL